MRAILATSLLVLAVAGCVAPPPEPADGAAVADASARALGGFADPLLLDHDHGDLATHTLMTPTMEALLNVQPQVGGLAYGEMDLLGDRHLVLSGLLDGFFILDVGDPAAPAVVSFTPDPGFIADVKASESGDFVFVGVQLAGFTGIHAYNVAVREAPALAGAFPMQGGCHMLAVHRDVLYCAPNDATVRLFRIVETPAAVALVPLSVYAPQANGPAAPLLLGASSGDEMTHDMTVQDDPLTGEAVMFVSFWDFGVRVVSVEDPAAPTELGAWLGEGAEETYEGNVHTTMAALVDGRRVVVTVPEYALAPAVTFLDATDYADMSVLGVWAPKTAEEWSADNPSLFSTHNFQVVGHHVYLGMYHGGVWVLDARTQAAVGYALPAVLREGPPVPALAMLGGTVPNVWDVVVNDGYVYASDIGTGLHVLRHVDDPLDDQHTSFG